MERHRHISRAGVPKRMITIPDTLSPDHVLLDLIVTDPARAIEQLAQVLRNDEHVLDWNVFYEAIRANPPCKVADVAPFGICIPHARTNAVTGMVLSAARCATRITFPDCDKPIRYIFCIGVPMALAADYLRIAGALMRLFTDPEAEAALRTADTPTEFIASLTRLERKL